MYQDIIKAFKTELKSMTTADNTEQMVKLDKFVDQLSSEHAKQEAEIGGLKDKLVEFVRGTNFKSNSDESSDIEGPTPLSIEDAIAQGIKNLNLKED